MQPEALELEKLRQQVEDAEFTLGDRADYLDYGKPNAAEKQKAQQVIEQMRRQSTELKTKLHETLAAVREARPEAFNEWIDYHKHILARIIAEPTTDANSKARQNVARDTLNQWEKVRAGELAYVNINWHFLKDYKAEVKTLFPAVPATEKKAEKENKKPWQFWK